MPLQTSNNTSHIGFYLHFMFILGDSFCSSSIISAFLFTLLFTALPMAPLVQQLSHSTSFEKAVSLKIFISTFLFCLEYFDYHSQEFSRSQKLLFQQHLGFYPFNFDFYHLFLEFFFICLLKYSSPSI